MIQEYAIISHEVTRDTSIQ